MRQAGCFGLRPVSLASFSIDGRQPDDRAPRAAISTACVQPADAGVSVSAEHIDARGAAQAVAPRQSAVRQAQAGEPSSANAGPARGRRSASSRIRGRRGRASRTRREQARAAPRGSAPGPAGASSSGTGGPLYEDGPSACRLSLRRSAATRRPARDRARDQEPPERSRCDGSQVGKNVCWIACLCGRTKKDPG